MKTIIKIILLILIPLLGVFILSYPGVWKYRVENILNRKILKESGWHISIGELSGHLFKQIDSKNIEITHDDGNRIFIPDLSTKINVRQSLAGNLYLKELNIYDFNYQDRAKKNKEKKPFEIPDLNYRRFPLRIDKLSFDGTLSVDLADSTHLIDLDILSAIYPNNNGLNIDIDTLFIKHHDIDYPINISKTKININNRVVEVNPINCSVADVLINGQISFIQEENQQLKGNINVNNIIIPDKLFENMPIQINFSKINSNWRFDTDFNNYSGNVSLKNEQGLSMTGDFNISKLQDRWLVQKIFLQSDSASMFINGEYINTKDINANLELKQLDLSKWLAQQTITNISGTAGFKTNFENGIIKSIALNLKTQETALFEDDTITVNGAFVYENNLIKFAEPFTVTLGSSSITSVGEIDFTEESIDLSLILTDADVFIINNFWSDSLENGTISGNIEASGKFNDPIVTGSIFGKNIQYKDFYISEFEFEGQRKKNNEDLGYAQLRLGNGHWNDIEFEKGNMDVVFKKKETHFTNVNIVNKDEYLIGSGWIDSKNTFHINNVRTFYQDHYFVNSDPFEISYIDKILRISPFIANLDDGIIEGEISFNKVLYGNIKFSNIDAKILHPFIDNDRYEFTGLMFGNINFEEIDGNQSYSIDASVKNGSFSDMQFQQINTSMDYKNHVLYIKELVLKETDKYHVAINGMIPFGEPNKSEKISLQSRFHDTNVKTITQFLPDWYEFSGIINGELNLSGTRENLISNFSAIVKNTIFDKISLGTVQGRGTYDGKKINLDSFSADNKYNHFTGYGYLPIDLNIKSEMFGNMGGDDSLFIFVEGKSKDLDFITKYFEEVDDAPGDYILALEVSGTWDNMIRNGRINASNATIFTPYLDDPIEKLHGFVRIENNQLIIDDLTGKMYRDAKRSTKKDDNVSLSGGMDMTSFFDPYININAVGKDVYFRSLIYEMEGTTDFNINVTGRDTVLISGIVAPLDIEMFQSFTTSELGILPTEEGSTIIHYKIDIPIKGKVTLTNDQFDAVLIGDISINQFGDREMDFAGEIIIEEGKFYYYGDIFKITDGYFTFDNHGFNPYLDISANTTIDGERIYISIAGTIDNPQLTFTSESGFSQSDILEILTLRKRFEEQDLSSTGIGYQASDMVFSWFGSQLDKNILKLSGLNRLSILENVDVHGTTGLLTAGKDFSISTPLTENVSINYAYRRSFGVLDSYHSLGVELRINRNLSLIGNIDRSGYMHLKYRLRYAY